MSKDTRDSTLLQFGGKGKGDREECYERRERALMRTRTCVLPLHICGVGPVVIHACYALSSYAGAYPHARIVPSVGKTLCLRKALRSTFQQNPIATQKERLTWAGVSRLGKRCLVGARAVLVLHQSSQMRGTGKGDARGAMQSAGGRSEVRDALRLIDALLATGRPTLVIYLRSITLACSRSCFYDIGERPGPPTRQVFLGLGSRAEVRIF
jgi:hypothetical protein